MLLLKSDVVPDGQEGSQKIIRLWIHEVYRVFYDRLVDETDRDTFFSMVKVSHHPYLKSYIFYCDLTKLVRAYLFTLQSGNKYKNYNIQGQNWNK